MNILIPDAGGYSSQLKAVFIQSLIEAAYGKDEAPFFDPVDDDKTKDVVNIYANLLGLSLSHTKKDVILPVSSATRMTQYGCFKNTDPMILSLFDNKRTLSDLAGGYEIPYMTSQHYNAVFKGNAIVKPCAGSGSKGIQVMQNSTQGKLDDHQIIQAISDDDREYVQDIYLELKPSGSLKPWCYHRQSIQRVEGRDIEVRFLPTNGPEVKAMREFAEFLAKRLTAFGVKDSMWCNVQYRYYNGLLRVMEIDSRISGSAQLNPWFGRALLRSLGYAVEEIDTSEWMGLGRKACIKAYETLGLVFKVESL